MLWHVYACIMWILLQSRSFDILELILSLERVSKVRLNQPAEPTQMSLDRLAETQGHSKSTDQNKYQEKADQKSPTEELSYPARKWLHNPAAPAKKSAEEKIRILIVTRLSIIITPGQLKVKSWRVQISSLHRKIAVDWGPPPYRNLSIDHHRMVVQDTCSLD